MWFKSPSYYGLWLGHWTQIPYVPYSWVDRRGIHFCCPEGATEVTALDGCPLVSVKVHLVAISLFLVGCPLRQISFYPVHSPGCLLVCRYLWFLWAPGKLQYMSIVSLFLSKTSPGGLPLQVFKIPTQKGQLVCSTRAWRSAWGLQWVMGDLSSHASSLWLHCHPISTAKIEEHKLLTCGPFAHLLQLVGINYSNLHYYIDYCPLRNI